MTSASDKSGFWDPTEPGGVTRTGGTSTASKTATKSASQSKHRESSKSTRGSESKSKESSKSSQRSLSKASEGAESTQRSHSRSKAGSETTHKSQSRPKEGSESSTSVHSKPPGGSGSSHRSHSKPPGESGSSTRAHSKSSGESGSSQKSRSRTLSQIKEGSRSGSGSTHRTRSSHSAGSGQTHSPRTHRHGDNLSTIPEQSSSGRGSSSANGAYGTWDIRSTTNRSPFGANPGPLEPKESPLMAGHLSDEQVARNLLHEDIIGNLYDSLQAGVISIKETANLKIPRPGDADFEELYYILLDAIEYKDEGPASAYPAEKECQSCLDTKSIDEFPMDKITADCEHDSEICLECLSESIKVQQNSKFWSNIVCPEQECKKKLTWHDMKLWASPESFRKYDSMVLRGAIQGEEDFHWCDGCSSGQIHLGGVAHPLLICASCGKRTCVVHKMPWHEGKSCAQFDEEAKARGGSRSSQSVASSSSSTTRPAGSESRYSSTKPAGSESRYNSIKPRGSESRYSSNDTTKRADKKPSSSHSKAHSTDSSKKKPAKEKERVSSSKATKEKLARDTERKARADREEKRRARKAKQKKDEERSERLVKKYSKACPGGCGNMNYRGDGCPHMQCICGYEYCDLCLAQWHPSHWCQSSALEFTENFNNPGQLRNVGTLPRRMGAGGGGRIAPGGGGRSGAGSW